MKTGWWLLWSFLVWSSIGYGELVGATISLDTLGLRQGFHAASGYQDLLGHLLVSPEFGTIIVTYQTDPTDEYLDRIRFWLVNTLEERTLYPKKDECVSNSHAPNERTVVIAHLAAGCYRIEFLIPNTKQMFEDVPPRIVNLTGGAVVKIDQAIRSRSLGHFNKE